MTLRVLCVALLAVLLCVDASPVQETENARVMVARTLRSVLNRLGLEPGSRVRREIETRQVVNMNCTDARECWPDGVSLVPSTLINCDPVIHQCICNECFFRNADTGRCEEDSCEDYFFENRECVDDRPSQLTAFLLSLFLSSTGAANFYIGQDGLGAGQLVILLVLIMSMYCICYIPCCMACCISKDEIKSSIFFIFLIFFMILIIVVVFCCAIANWAWWIADLIIFATDQRDAGNGCDLSPDL